MRVCRWYDNARAAAVLMIDDLSDAYVDIDGIGLNASNDWGHGGLDKNGIFRYFEDNFLAAHPQVKYTVFLPFGEHSAALVPCRYSTHAADAFSSESFRSLLGYIVASGNEIAYHGHHHGVVEPSLDPDTWWHEFEAVGPQKYREIMLEDLYRARAELGIDIRGGKSPGYICPPEFEQMILESSLLWWAFEYNSNRNDSAYRGSTLDFPCNLAGSCLNPSRRLFGYVVRKHRTRTALKRIVESGGIVAVQEHFLSTRPDGKRQTPCIYDDSESLKMLFDLIAGHDVWYATCSEIARYAQTRDNTAIEKLDDGSWKVSYRGDWDEPLISVISDCRAIKNIITGEVIEGRSKDGVWIYNRIPECTYLEMEAR
jgi:hypothetical protein